MERGGFEEVLTTSGPEDVLPLADAGILLISRTGSYLVDLERDRPGVPPVDAVWNDHGPCSRCGLVVAVREGDAVRVITPLGTLELPGARKVLWLDDRLVVYEGKDGALHVVTHDGRRAPGEAEDAEMVKRVGPFVVLRERGTYELLARLTDGPRVGLPLPEVRGREVVHRIDDCECPIDPKDPLPERQVPDAGTSSRPRAGRPTGRLVPTGRERDVPRPEGRGRDRVELSTVFGPVRVRTELTGDPVIAGLNRSLLTVVYRAPDGTAHDALLSPTPIVGRYTDKGGRETGARRSGARRPPTARREGDPDVAPRGLDGARVRVRHEGRGPDVTTCSRGPCTTPRDAPWTAGPDRRRGARARPWSYPRRSFPSLRRYYPVATVPALLVRSRKPRPATASS